MATNQNQKPPFPPAMLPNPDQVLPSAPFANLLAEIKETTKGSTVAPPTSPVPEGTNVEAVAESTAVTSTVGNVIALAKNLYHQFSEAAATIKEMSQKFDTNRDGRIDKRELSVMFASKEFWAIMSLLFLPIAWSLIEVLQFFLSSGSYDFSKTLIIVEAVYLPLALAWARRNFMAVTRNLEDRYKTNTEAFKSRRASAELEIKQFTNYLNLNHQYIKMNIPATGQPVDENTFKGQYVPPSLPAQSTATSDIAREIDEMLSKTEFGSMVILFILPMVIAPVQVLIIYFITKVWIWNLIYTSLLFILLPVLLPMLRKRFDKESQAIKKQLLDLDAERQAFDMKFMQERDQLLTAINLQTQYICLFGDKSKAPLLIGDLPLEELKNQNAGLMMDKMRLETQYRGLLQYVKTLDPEFKTKFGTISLPPA